MDGGFGGQAAGGGQGVQAVTAEFGVVMVVGDQRERGKYRLQPLRGIPSAFDTGEPGLVPCKVTSPSARSPRPSAGQGGDIRYTSRHGGYILSYIET